MTDIAESYQQALKVLFNENEQRKLTQEEQVYIKECLKIKLDMSIYSGEYTYARKLFEKVLFELVLHHVDTVVVFMKAFAKKLANHRDAFGIEHAEICKFLVLNNFIDKAKSEEKLQGVYKYNKVLQHALRILHKSWRATLTCPKEQNTWSNHV
jgi:hypothetical protein